MIQYLNLDKGPQMKSIKYNHVVLSEVAHVCDHNTWEMSHPQLHSEGEQPKLHETQNPN